MYACLSHDGESLVNLSCLSSGVAAAVLHACETNLRDCAGIQL